MTRILTIIALLFSTPAWAQSWNDQEVLYCEEEAATGFRRDGFGTSSIQFEPQRFKVFLTKKDSVKYWAKIFGSSLLCDAAVRGNVICTDGAYLNVFNMFDFKFVITKNMADFVFGTPQANKISDLVIARGKCEVF